MLRIYAGDPFLARRSAIRALGELRAGDPTLEVVRQDEGASARSVAEAAGQSGLFGRVVLFLDLDEAFAGAGHTAERNAVIDALAAAAATFADGSAEGIVLDAAATDARQRRWRSLGTLEVTPTPRYGQLVRWVARELTDAKVAVRGDVAGTLADLFGDDLPGIVGEVGKLALLDGAITPERVRDIAHRPAARSAFALTDAIAAGDLTLALQTARGLLDLGEAPVRVMAALAWQIDLIARCAALALRDPAVTPEAAARALASAPYPTRKALAVARGLDERAIGDLALRAVAADVAMKSGRDPSWALESAVLDLTRCFAAAAAPPAAPTGRSGGERRGQSPSGR